MIMATHTGRYGVTADPHWPTFHEARALKIVAAVVSMLAG
jgi:hypothetical protein